MGTVIGARQIPRREDQQTISADDVIRMIGGTYRLASIAVDMEMDLLTRRVGEPQQSQSGRYPSIDARA
jgi:hypothetical protein